MLRCDFDEMISLLAFCFMHETLMNVFLTRVLVISKYNNVVDNGEDCM